MNDNFNNVPKRVDPTYSNFNENPSEETPGDYSVYASPDPNTFDSGTAVGSIILVIRSTILFWVPVLPLILGAIGIFLCSEDRKKCMAYKKTFSGTATAGKAMSLVGIALNLIMYIVFLFIPSMFAAFFAIFAI